MTSRRSSAIRPGDRTIKLVLSAGPALLALWLPTQAAWAFATPTLTTTANPTTLELGTGSVPLTDTATLSGGSSPTGIITFTLTGPSGLTSTEEVNLSGISATATISLLTTGMIPGPYTWTAIYSGDDNNSSVTAPAESVTVNQAGTDLITEFTAHMVGEPMTDLAFLEGGYFPTGTITFNLLDPSNTRVLSDTVKVNNGNGLYQSPTSFAPSSAGQYQWEVVYNGDSNNLSSSDTEPVTVSGPESVPEPSTLALLGSALMALGPIRRRTRKSSKEIDASWRVDE